MFQHHDDVWRAFPTLAAGALLIPAPPPPERVADVVRRQVEVARDRLAAGPEGQLPEIQAWRRAFTAMRVNATRVSVLTRDERRFTI